MAEKKRRLSDLVKAGVDYPAKVKITDVLDVEVEVIDFKRVTIMKEVTLKDGTKDEVVDADYYNVVVKDKGLIKTFSTGAVPIMNVLGGIDKDELPAWTTFSKKGQTYVTR